MRETKQFRPSVKNTIICSVAIADALTTSSFWLTDEHKSNRRNIIAGDTHNPLFEVHCRQDYSLALQMMALNAGIAVSLDILGAPIGALDYLAILLDAVEEKIA